MSSSTLILMLIPLLAIQIGLQIFALVDIYRHKGTQPPLPVWAWILIVVLGELVGVLLYFAIGRKPDMGGDDLE